MFTFPLVVGNSSNALSCVLCTLSNIPLGGVHDDGTSSWCSRPEQEGVWPACKSQQENNYIVYVRIIIKTPNFLFWYVNKLQNAARCRSCQFEKGENPKWRKTEAVRKLLPAVSTSCLPRLPRVSPLKRCTEPNHLVGEPSASLQAERLTRHPWARS